MQKKILLIGDSWFAGCWSIDGRIVHPGVAGFLRQHGYIVKNLAHGGNTNRMSIERLIEYVEKYDHRENYHVLFVITDPLREYNVLSNCRSETISNHVCDEVTTRTQLIARHNDQIQHDLEYFNNVAKQYNMRFILFGGLCELKSEYIEGYDNLELGLESWQKFIDNNLDIPIVSRGDWQYLISHSSKTCLVELAEEVHSFYWDTLRKHPGFQPDGSHPSIKSHEKLADYIDNLIKSDKY